MFMGAYALQDAIYTIIETERQRFIASGGYEEAGWKIVPLVDGDGFAVQITNASPGPGVTGRVRRESDNK